MNHSIIGTNLFSKRKSGRVEDGEGHGRTIHRLMGMSAERKISVIK